MLDILHTILSFVVIMSVIVFIHEFGHYIIAKWSGVKIEVFAIGFGKEIFGFNDKSGTRWKFCMIPMGGYVKMFGDASEVSNADGDAIEAMSDEDKALTFHYKPLWKKAAIVVAGPVANFILTITIFTGLIFANGITVTDPIIGEVIADTPAMESGLKMGDRILTVDGEVMEHFRDIPQQILINTGSPVKLEVLREGSAEPLVFHITPKLTEEEDALGNTIKRPLIGFRSLKLELEDVGLPRAVWEASKQTYDITMMTFDYLGQVISGDRSAKELQGPVGIAKLSGQATEKGWITVIWFMAMLSANLGMINLFPIPPLDGGHLLYYSIEAMRGGRPMAEKYQEYGFRVGFALVLSLMAFTVFNDIRNLFV